MLLQKLNHIGFIYIDEEIKMNFNFIFTYKKTQMFCIHIPHSRINTSTWGMTHGVMTREHMASAIWGPRFVKPSD